MSESILPGLELDRREVRLLGDPHGGARMALAELDHAHPGERRAVSSQSSAAKRLASPTSHSAGSMSRRGWKLPKPLKARLSGREQVPHQVLDAAGEEVAHALAALEDRAHPLGHGIRVAVGLALRRHLLELVDEQDHPLGVRLCHALGKSQRGVERLLRVPGRQPGRERQLDAVAQLALHLQRGARLGGRQRGPTDNRAPAAPARCHAPRLVERRNGDGLRQLGGVADPEQVHPGHVASPRPLARVSAASHTLVLPVRRGPATIRCVPFSSAVVISRTSSARPIIWLAGIGLSVGKRSPLRSRMQPG